MDYIDLNLRVGPRLDENRYAVYARSPVVGELGGGFTPPITGDQLELFVLKVGMTRRGARQIHSPEWRAARDFGQKLFAALFAEHILSAFIATHNEAIRQGKGVRLTLSLDAPELSNYPWEFLYDADAGQFLSLFEDTPVVRYVELLRPILPLTVAPPLRILAVASSPRDFYPLDLARERRNLSQALENQVQAGLIEIDWLSVATIEALREQLLKRTYHIFHFIGHGGFDDAQQDGVLMFEAASGDSKIVSGERLAVLLGNHRTLRLAVLNACEGARTSSQDPFAGTALTLMRTGNLPAVVAMQFEITDEAAIDFSRGFYAALATGRPVDAAVAQGRQAIFADDNDTEWSTPVLYLRAADGRIFDIDAAGAAQKAEQERVAREQAEQARLAREKAEAEKLAAARAEQQRQAEVQAEAERQAKEKQAQEQAAAARAEEERRAKEQAEAQQQAAALGEQKQQAKDAAEEPSGAREKPDAERDASWTESVIIPQPSVRSPQPQPAAHPAPVATDGLRHALMQTFPIIWLPVVLIALGWLVGQYIVNDIPDSHEGLAWYTDSFSSIEAFIKLVIRPLVAGLIAGAFAAGALALVLPRFGRRPVLALVAGWGLSFLLYPTISLLHPDSYVYDNIARLLVLQSVFALSIGLLTGLSLYLWQDIIGRNKIALITLAWLAAVLASVILYILALVSFQFDSGFYPMALLAGALGALLTLFVIRPQWAAPPRA